MNDFVAYFLRGGAGQIAREELARLRTQRDAALALHERYEPTGNGVRFFTRCAHCRHRDGTFMTWPCPTARALGVTS